VYDSSTLGSVQILIDNTFGRCAAYPSTVNNIFCTHQSIMSAKHYCDSSMSIDSTNMLVKVFSDITMLQRWLNDIIIRYEKLGARQPRCAQRKQSRVQRQEKVESPSLPRIKGQINLPGMPTSFWISSAHHATMKHTHTFTSHTFYPTRPASRCHAVRFCPRTSSRRRMGVTLNSPTKGRVEVVQLNFCDTTINWKYPFLTGPEWGFESDSCKWIYMSSKN